MNTPELHEYLEKDKEYILRIKVTTDDKDVKSKLASMIFGSILNEEAFLEGADCKAFYKQNYSEQDLLSDTKDKVFNSIIQDVKRKLDEITLTEIDVNSISL